MEYKIENNILPGPIIELRQSVGWNAMEKEFANPKKNNLFEIGCYDIISW